MITLDEVKTYLGLDTALYNTQISRYIPIVTAKVIQIGNHMYNTPSYAELTEDSPNLEILDGTIKAYRYGQAITGEGIPEGAYVTQVYPEGITEDDIAPTVTISENAAVTENNRVFIGASIDLKIVMAQAVWWFISRESTDAQPKNSVSSKSVNGMSVSYTNAEIDNYYGVPAWFVKAIPVYENMK